MRTTVTLDPDTEQIVRDRMDARGLSFKQALNDAIRAGATGRPDYVFRQTTHDMGVPATDLTKANEIAAVLENEEILAPSRTGR